MATVQVAPQQPQPPVGPSSYAADPSPSSRRQYQSSPSMSDQPRSSSDARGSPHSSRRPSRRPSGNTTQPSTSDALPAIQPSAFNTPRVPEIPATHSSPVAPLASSSPSQEQHRSRREHRAQNSQPGGPPFSPPPRTSSNQRYQTSGPPSEAPLVDRTIPQAQNYDDHSRSARRARDDAQSTSAYPRSSEQPTNRDPAIEGTSTSQNRKRTQASPQMPQQPMATSDRSVQQTSKPGNSRSGTSENTVINRQVVDDPVVDVRREEERQLEAVPGLNIDNNRSAANVSSNAKSRQDFSAQNSANSGKRKEVRFGEYVLGQTLGEGEFGKVKLGWKKDGTYVEVAIKLIRRESLGTNPSRLPKIKREIDILKTLQHANIVKLHEMVETTQYIGMVLEYASGGELFDYILNQRYLKDPTARKLFAQLVSGVGYLHKKGIVHRDLKLENLLLDRNRNIIITDFGFANTFNPKDELGEAVESRLTDREFVKRMDLERIRNGSRKGDLMATSCGSPCYAAPELVVTDSLYTGRKVDVWSCGVILYAMLAGYLPFDDDPENPDGDNINQLYKYITTTPLTFPEYVTPHARDLLRRILVPDPRKRADLFEVARHSWLLDYAHVVSRITSGTTEEEDLASATVTADAQDAPSLIRSHSVREPAKPGPSDMSPTNLSHQGKIDTKQTTARSDSNRDPKRRTVQVEYVAPQRQTVRGEPMPSSGSPRTDAITTVAPGAQSRSRTRAGTEGLEPVNRQYPATTKPLPQDSRSSSEKAYDSQQTANRSSQRPTSSQRDMAPPIRPPKDFPRSVSDSTSAFGQAPTSMSRPMTGGSMASTSQGRLPSRGNSYSQPLAPTVAATNAQGRVTQPKSENKYNISAPMPIPEPYIPSDGSRRPSVQQYGSPPPPGPGQRAEQGRNHKRSNTLGNFFRTGSISVPRTQSQSPAETPPREKKYPPTSMKSPLPASNSPRQSMDSRRPSFSFSRKSRENSDISKQEKSRRFSLLPASFSLKSFTSAGNGKDGSGEYRPASERRQSNAQGQVMPAQSSSRPQTMNYQKSRSDNRSLGPDPTSPDTFDGHQDPSRAGQPRRNEYGSRGSTAAQQAQYSAGRYQQDEYLPPRSQAQGPSYYSTNNESEVSLQDRQYRPVYPPGFGSEDQEEPPRKSTQQGRPARVLQKNNRRFADAYEQDQEPRSGVGQHSGSSGAAKRVMDFFRRRGKARAGDER